VRFVFFVKIRKGKAYKTGYQVELNFILVQHSRDPFLMNSIMNRFNCGIIYEKPKNNQVHYVVFKFADIKNKIIPFFSDHPLQGSKASDFTDFCIVAKLMEDKAHLNNEGLNKIVLIKKGMNFGKES
jgi:hypothetical protein